MTTLPRYAEVAVALPVDELFTYRVPDGWSLQVGTAVLVPFGRQRITGYVIGFRDDAPVARIKAIARVLDEVPAVDAAQIAFCQWTAAYYLSGLGEVIATALPSAYRAKVRRVYLPTDSATDALARAEVDESVRMAVLRNVVARPGRTTRGVQRSLSDEFEGAAVGKALAALVRAGLIAVQELEASGPKGTVVTVRLADPGRAAPVTAGARMRGVLAALHEASGEMDLSALERLEGAGARSAVKRLEEKGYVVRGEREDRRAATGQAPLEDAGPPPTLNPAQSAALDQILAADAGPILLHGVTGSGKTEVYLHAAAAVLGRDKQVLVLVPEIALTPLLTGRFRARFGGAVAVLHSGLTGADRLREWRRIRAGDARVAVGARSALFAPFQRLGLIVVDEEHDDSYKQEDGVRYHARDLAVVRGKQAGCPVVLGSATPALETWKNAKDGRYGLVRLAERATPRAVPQVELLDMRGRPSDQALAPELVTALTQTLHAGGKAIVLYNRRGYAPVVECGSCGAHYTCPSCGVGMVLHQRRARMICHYCAFHRPYQPDCPSCGDALSVIGHGTERVEEALAQAFPGVGIARMDADTTRQRGAHHRILSGFRAGDARLLVGTQVVAKGHDFPDVHLAAVVGVDHLLTMPDFRSAERTWALVTQLAGRAGRGDVAGKVLVQTRHCDHFIFRLLAQGDADLDAFYAEESDQRAMLGYPPYRRLAMVRVEGSDPDATEKRARGLARELRLAGPGADVLGPTPAPLSRLVGRWRWQLVLRGSPSGGFRGFLARARPALRTRGKLGVRVSVDVDPRNLL